MRLGSLVILLAASLGVGTTSLAVAQQKGAKSIVAVRQATMDASGAHMSAIKFILTETPELTKRVAFHANAIAEASEHTPELFPAGSTQAPTDALPPIWEKPDEFRQAAERAQDLAQKLAQTAEAGDAQATLVAFGTLGKEGCGGCHTTFRKKQQ